MDPDDPATYIVHGRQDGTYRQATDLAAALTAAGVPFGFPLIDGAHGPFGALLNTDLGDRHLVIDDMFEFFDDQLDLQALTIPEPSSLLLASLGGVFIGFRRRQVYVRRCAQPRVDTD